jgi:hypothetical protein
MTIANVTADVDTINKLKPTGLIKEIVAIQSPTSVQLRFRLSDKVAASEITKQQNLEEIVISLRTVHEHLFAQGNTEPNVPEKEGKIASVLRVNSQSPKIDGYLNDLIWQKAQIISDFTQEDPENGEQPTEKTEVQVAFDEEAVCVAVRAFDSNPDQIIGRITRRDVDSESDWITIAFDSQHDHQTGSKRKSKTAVGHRSSGFRFQYCASPRQKNRNGDSTSGAPSTAKMKPSLGYINLEMLSEKFPDSVIWFELAKSNRQDIWKRCLILFLGRHLIPNNKIILPDLVLT